MQTSVLIHRLIIVLATFSVSCFTPDRRPPFFGTTENPPLTTQGAPVETTPTTSEGSSTTDMVPTTGSDLTEGTAGQPSALCVNHCEQCPDSVVCPDCGSEGVCSEQGNALFECFVYEDICQPDTEHCVLELENYYNCTVILSCGNGQIDAGEQCDNGSCTAQDGECSQGFCTLTDKPCNSDIPHPQKKTCSLNCNNQGASGNVAPFKPESSSPLD